MIFSNPIGQRARGSAKVALRCLQRVPLLPAKNVRAKTRRSWFRRAAEQGAADASAHLGWMQVEGKAGTGDESQEGLARLEEAANGGSALAQERNYWSRLAWVSC